MTGYSVIDVRKTRTDIIALVMKNDLGAHERFIVAKGFSVNCSADNPVWFGGGTYYNDLLEAVQDFEERTRI